jgi:hypothetical protein
MFIIANTITSLGVSFAEVIAIFIVPILIVLGSYEGYLIIKSRSKNSYFHRKYK